MNFKNILLIPFLVILCNIANAQLHVPNIDFETGTLSNWEYFTGTCCPIVTPSGTAPVPGMHTLTSGTATDPLGGFPIVSPTGGSYSMQIGNSSTSGASRVRYYVHVPTGADYSFIYHYAVVLSGSVHSPAMDPRMEIKAFDSVTGMTLPCASFSYSSSSTIPGFTHGSMVDYLPWKTGTFNFAGYGGRTICLDFAASFCGYGGHFGYGYVDVTPGLFANILPCTTITTTLNGPDGYTTYRWCDSATYSITYGTTRSITIPSPGVRTTYALIATPYPGYGCPDTTYTVLTPIVSCSGTPAIGTAYYTSSANCGDPDTLTVTGYSLICGLTFQWQSSPDNITWTNVAGATTVSYPYFSPYTDMYYRCMVTCTVSGLTNVSTSVFVPARGGSILYTVINPPDSVCNGADFYVSTCGASTLYSVITYYGDGTFDTTLLSTTGLRHADFVHYYGFPGTYTIKQILFDGTLAIDSTIYSHNYIYCSTMPLKFYYDLDNDCVHDRTEEYLRSAIKIKIDSNGYAIDTISVLSGAYYTTNGGAGTVYKFNPIEPPAFTYVTCPSPGFIQDTIQSFVNLYDSKYFGLNCSSGGFDLSEYYMNIETAGDVVRGTIYINNETKCNSMGAHVKLIFSPKYVFRYSSPSSPIITDNTAIWTIPNIATAHRIYYVLDNNPTTGLLAVGDTIHSEIIITPIVGDFDTTNNHEIIIDTVKYSHDPNAIKVTPAGCLPSGISSMELRYMIQFENTGNDTAHNIYVMDTISDNLDIRTLEMVTASHRMDIATMNVGGHNMIKFDFPGIDLPDSSHHDECHGMVIYKIKTRAGLADGANILNRAGIYFDINPVVMTNTVENVIGCPLLNVQEVSKEQTMQLYPNPAKDELIVKMSSTMNGTVEVTNQVGQVLMKQPMNGAQTKLNIKSLPAGIYFLSATTTSGKYNSKFTVVK